MDTEMERKPRIRRNHNFIVESNVDAVQWPQECVVCGSPPQAFDSIHLSKNFKNLGLVKTEVSNIPYCGTCFPKIKHTKRLDRSVIILAFVFGIPLGILLAALIARQPGTRFICLGLLVLLGIVIAYGFFWLLIRFPVKSIFKDKFVEEVVTASLNEVTRLDGSQGFNVSISITRPEYAQKFSDLNEVEPEVPV